MSDKVLYNLELDVRGTGQQFKTIVAQTEWRETAINWAHQISKLLPSLIVTVTDTKCRMVCVFYSIEWKE